MQIERGISLGECRHISRRGGAAPFRNEGASPRSPASAEILRAVISHSERLPEPDPSQDAGAG